MRRPNSIAGLLLSLTGAACAAQAALAAPADTWNVSLEALSWRLNDSPIPFPIISDGIIGAPGTQVLLGDEALSTGTHRGARLGIGYAFDAQWGIEASAFGLQSRRVGGGVASSGQVGSVDLILPYIDAITGEEAGSELSQAQIYRGSAYHEVRDRLRGAELDLRWTVAADEAWQLDLLGGLRHLDFRESWTLATESPYLPAFEPDVWQTLDRFDSRNRYYGVQAGLRAQAAAGRWFGVASLKAAAGTMRQSTDVQGSLRTNDFTAFGATETFVGGYFAQPSNIGRHTRSQFALVGEAALGLGLRLGDHATLGLGYSLLQADKVLRPGNQVDRRINPTQSTSFTEDPAPTPSGPLAPQFTAHNSRLRAQGINLHFAVRF